MKRIAQYLLVVMQYLNFYELRLVSKKEIKKAAKKWAKNETIFKRKTNYSKIAEARFIRDAEHWLDTTWLLGKGK